MKLINLTPHNVNILNEHDQHLLVIPPESTPARCVEDFDPIDWKLPFRGAEIPIGVLSYADVRDLPEPDAQTFFIVSVLVAQQYPHRYDLLVPYDLVRKDGQIIGCRKLVKISNG